MAAQNQNWVLTPEETRDQILNITQRLFNIESLLHAIAQPNPQYANQQQPNTPQAVNAPYLVPPLAAPVYGYQVPVGIPVAIPVVAQLTPQQVYDHVSRVFGQALSNYLNQNPDLRRLIP